MTYRILTIAAFASVLLAACTENPLEEKKKKLAEYKTEVKELNVKIGDLEKEIAKLDTSFHIELKAKRIDVAPLEKQDFKHYIEVQGTVDAEENVTALPQQPGLVTAIYVKVGDRVTKGQVLGLTETTAAMEIAVQGQVIALGHAAV